jgi:hypothetical protein
MSSFVGGPPHVPGPMAARGLYSPDVVQAYPRIGFTDWLYYRLTGLPIARPYITPQENLYLQQLYMNYMTSPLNMASWGMQIASIPLGFINPWLGIGVGLGGYALGQFASRYIYRFDEVERTRQMLGVHFQNWTRMGYKGMDVSEAAKANFAIIEASLESATFGISEMRDIAAKISQTNLLGGLRTVDDFKQRFKQLVGVLREITGALHITYDEAIQLVSERVANGMSPEDVATFSYRTRNIAAAAGVNPAAVTRNIEGTAQMLTQYGLSMNAGTNLAGLSYTILGAAKNVMPASQYNALNLEGRQEPISQSLNELFTRLVTNNSMFQLALIGAQSLGGTPMALENADFLKLTYAGQLEAANNWALLRKEGRMGRISEIISQNPMLVLETTRKYIEYLASAMPGVEKNEAMKQILMGMGITNPEYAQTVAKLFEQLPTGATQLFGLSLNSQADLERLRDKAIQQAQDQMMGYWKQLWASIAIWEPNWVGWRAISQWMADRAARQGQELFFQQYGWAYQPGLYGQFFASNLGQSGFEALFGPAGFQPVANPQMFAQEAGIKAITPQEYLSIIASAYGTNAKQLYSGLAALATYGTYALPEFQVPGMSQADVERLRAFAGAGRAMFTYLTEEDIKKVKETKSSLEEKIKSGEALEVKLSPYQTLKIDPQQWRSFSEELKEAIAAALVAQGLKMDEVIDRIGTKLSQRQSTPAASPTFQKIEAAYLGTIASEEQRQELAKRLEEGVKRDRGLIGLATYLSAYKDKLTPDLVRGILAGDPNAYYEAAQKGIPAELVYQLDYAYKNWKGTIEPELVFGLPGIDIIQGKIVPDNIIWNKGALDTLAAHLSAGTAHGRIALNAELLRPDKVKELGNVWSQIKKAAASNPTLLKYVKDIQKEAEEYYKAYGKTYGLSLEQVETIAFLRRPQVREYIEANPKALDTLVEKATTSPGILTSTLSGRYRWSGIAPLEYEMARYITTLYPGLSDIAQNYKIPMYYKATDPVAVAYGLFGLKPEKLSKTQKQAVMDISNLVSQYLKDNALDFGEMATIAEQLGSKEYFPKFQQFMGLVMGNQEIANQMLSDPKMRDQIIKTFVMELPFLTGGEKSLTILRQQFAETYMSSAGLQKGIELFQKIGLGGNLLDILSKLDISGVFSDLGDTTSKVNQTLSQFNDTLEKTNKKMSDFANKLNQQNAPSAPQRTQDVGSKFSGKR